MLSEPSHRLPDPPPSSLPDLLLEEYKSYVPRPQTSVSRRWTFGDVFFVGLAIAVWIMLLAGLVIITSDGASTMDQLVIYSVGATGVFVATFISTLAIVRRRGHSMADLGFRAPSFLWIIVAMMLGIVFVPIRIKLADYIDSIVDIPQDDAQVIESFDPLALIIIGLLSLLMIVVLAPVVEELVFRGVLYGWMRIRIGIFPAIVLNGFLFGLAHLDPMMVFVNTILGWVLAAGYELSKSLWVAMIIHLINNTLVVGLAMMGASAQ